MHSITRKRGPSRIAHLRELPSRHFGRLWQPGRHPQKHPRARREHTVVKGRTCKLRVERLSAQGTERRIFIKLLRFVETEHKTACSYPERDQNKRINMNTSLQKITIPADWDTSKDMAFIRDHSVIGNTFDEVLGKVFLQVRR